MIVRGVWPNTLGLLERLISGTTGSSVVPATFGTRNATLNLFLLQTGVFFIHYNTNALVVLGCLSLVVGFSVWSKFESQHEISMGMINDPLYPPS